MIEAAIRAVAVMAGILVMWLFVQTVWRRVFARDAPEHSSRCSGWNCRLCQAKQEDGWKVQEQGPESDTSDQRKGTRHEIAGL